MLVIDDRDLLAAVVCADREILAGVVGNLKQLVLPAHQLSLAGAGVILRELGVTRESQIDRRSRRHVLARADLPHGFAFSDPCTDLLLQFGREDFAVSHAGAAPCRRLGRADNAQSAAPTSRSLPR